MCPCVCVDFAMPAEISVLPTYVHSWGARTRLLDSKIWSLPFLGLSRGGGRGGAIQGKEGIKFCSVVLHAQRAKHIQSKNLTIAIWQPWCLPLLFGTCLMDPPSFILSFSLFALNIWGSLLNFLPLLQGRDGRRTRSRGGTESLVGRPSLVVRVGIGYGYGDGGIMDSEAAARSLYNVRKIFRLFYPSPSCPHLALLFTIIIT